MLTTTKSFFMSFLFWLMKLILVLVNFVTSRRAFGSSIPPLTLLGPSYKKNPLAQQLICILGQFHQH
jgi:hypothetical protein